MREIQTQPGDDNAVGAGSDGGTRGACIKSRVTDSSAFSFTYVSHPEANVFSCYWYIRNGGPEYSAQQVQTGKLGFVNGNNAYWATGFVKGTCQDAVIVKMSECLSR